MRNRSGANFDELLNKDSNILSKNQQLELQNQYKKVEQKSGGITFYDLIFILRSLIFNFSDEMRNQINKDITQKQIRVLDLNVLFSYALKIKKEKQQTNKSQTSEDNQYLDAFVALGEHSDKSGSVSKSALLQTVKNQFQLTFDIEAMIEGVSEDNLDYANFCSIFEHDRENGNGRFASAASQRTFRSNTTIRQLEFEKNDFQKFMSRFEQQKRFEKRPT